MKSAVGSVERQQNKATTRILRVLEAFSHSVEPLGVTELARQLDLSKNMVFRALSTLVEQGLVVRDKSGARYELGFGVLSLINHNFPEPDFRTLAKPFLARISELSGETTILSIPNGDKQVVIDGVEGQGRVVVKVSLGMTMPLHASAASRAILSTFTDDEIRAYIKRNKPLTKFTSSTMTTERDLIAEAKAIREIGYAKGRSDYQTRANSLSFPFVGIDGRAHGAITVGGPRARFTDEIVQDLLPTLIEISNELQQRTALFVPAHQRAGDAI